MSAAALLAVTASSSAQTTAIFLPLDKISPDDVAVEPWAVSADGRVVVGSSGSRAFRWTRADGMQPLGAFANPGGFQKSVAYAVSADGSVIVGASVRPDSDVDLGAPFRWTQASGLSFLGRLDPSVSTGAATGVSADGSTVVGYSVSASSSEFFGTEAFRWTASTALAGLGDLASGPFESQALDVSGDAAVILGRGSAAIARDSNVLWTDETGIVDFGPTVPTELLRISADGQTFVGRQGGPFGFGFVLDHGEPFVIERLDAELGDSDYALGVSGDGSLVSGSMNINSNRAIGAGRAFIWDRVNGTRLLQNLLVQNYGLDLTGWELNSAVAISDDGSTIVGRGFAPSGDQIGWVVVFSDGSIGACCSNSGVCSTVTRTVCTGTWTRSGVCDPNPCTPVPAATGPCCAGLECSVTTRPACEGVWSMGGVCGPETCQPLEQMGACCISFNNSCMITPASQCFETWIAEAVCEPTPCPGPFGACCLSDGSCLDASENTCPPGSTFHRFGACEFGPCAPPACRADFDNQNGVQVADIFAFLRAWFANAPSADFDGQNGIQVADIFAFLRSWFAGCP